MLPLLLVLLLLLLVVLVLWLAEGVVVSASGWATAVEVRVLPEATETLGARTAAAPVPSLMGMGKGCMSWLAITV